MRTPNRIALVLLSFCLSAFALGCGDDNPAGPGGNGNGGGGNGGGGGGGGFGSQQLDGRWAITEFSFNGTDVIAIGSVMELEFDETGRATTGTFSISIANDYLDWCDGEEDCTPTGPYEESSGGIVVFYPQTDDEIVWNYAISGNTLTMEAGQQGMTLVLAGDRI